MGGAGPTDPERPEPRDVPELLRPALAALARRRLGSRADPGLYPAALGARHRADRPGGPGGLRRDSLPQWRDVLYARLRRRRPARPARADRGGPGGRHWLRLPGADHRLLAGPRRDVRAARDQRLAPGRAGRLAAERDRAPAPLRPGQRHDLDQGPARRVGALVGGPAREPPVLSGPGLLPLPARAAVVGRGADDDPRYLRDRDGPRQGT